MRYVALQLGLFAGLFFWRILLVAPTQQAILDLLAVKQLLLPVVSLKTVVTPFSSAVKAETLMLEQLARGESAN
jgi:hypothetical protein